MARTDRFMIAPLTSGQQTDLKPWLIPDDAYQSLNNAYVFRGRVRKRFGSRFMEGSTAPTAGYASLQSRLRVSLGTTTGAGGFTGFVPRTGLVPNATAAIGMAFSVGDQIYTLTVLSGAATALKNTGAGTGTYDTTSGGVFSGQLVIVGATALTAVYFYPALPVMGLITYKQLAVSNELVFGFDTRFAYEFNTAGWTRLGTAVWKGNDTNFFWGSSYRGPSGANNYLFVTNYNAANGNTIALSDTIKLWDSATWVDFNPRFSSTDATKTIVTSRLIMSYKGRLLLLNVVENTAGGVENVTFVNRVRYSALGDPTDATAFYAIAGKGGFEDAPVKEAIITAQFLKDRLIVYFEQSTWELAYTGNEVRPFRWQQINTELGAESTFSQVPFDKVVLGIGNVGIMACNGTGVNRIDEKIPDQVFSFHNADSGVERIAGIRDFYVEMVYWAFPDVTRNATFPYNNKVLTYNYKTGSWGINDDSITTFGYFQAAANEGETWATDMDTWETDNSTWYDGTSVQSLFRSVVAGNQEGFVFIVDPDENRNCPALQITDMTVASDTVTIVAVNHNLKRGDDGEGDYIAIENVQGLTGINGLIFPVDAIDATLPATTFTIKIVSGSVTGSYTGGGTIARVSNIDILTKQYNFYVQDGYNASINKVDFLVDKTSDGEITVDYFLSSTSTSVLSEGQETGALIGTGVLETRPYLSYIEIGNTNALGAATGVTRGVITTKFVIGTQVFTVTAASGALTTTGTGTGTFDTITGAYTFTGCAISSKILVSQYLIPLELEQDRLWHPVYTMAEGECIQLNIYMTESQLRTPSIAWSDFELNAMTFYSQKTSSRLQ
jgi:hypothetical protein